MDNDLNLTIAEVIKKYHLLNNKHHSKSLGQNFLCDVSLLDKIVNCALPFENSDIVEIGPGPCGLTRSIISRAGNSSVICIEKDIRLKPLHDNILKNTTANLEFIYDDALKIDIKSLTSSDITIISNLPYNVGTRLLLNWIKTLQKIKSMTLMFQTEVADRICAKVGTKEYGRLSVLVQATCDVAKCFEVSNKAFFPVPKVNSCVVKLIPRNTNIDYKSLEKITSIFFTYRRKTIKSILSKHFSYFDEKQFEQLGISYNARPDSLSVAEYLKMTQILKNL